MLRSRHYYQGEKATVRVALHVANLTEECSRLRLAVAEEAGRELISSEVPRRRAALLQLGLALGRLKKPGFYRLRLQLPAADGTEVGRDDQPISNHVMEGPVYEEARQ